MGVGGRGGSGLGASMGGGWLWCALVPWSVPPFDPSAVLHANPACGPAAAGLTVLRCRGRQPSWSHYRGIVRGSQKELRVFRRAFPMGVRVHGIRLERLVLALSRDAGSCWPRTNARCDSYNYTAAVASAKADAGTRDEP